MVWGLEAREVHRTAEVQRTEGGGSAGQIQVHRTVDVQRTGPALS